MCKKKIKCEIKSWTVNVPLTGDSSCQPVRLQLNLQFTTHLLFFVQLYYMAVVATVIHLCVCPSVYHLLVFYQHIQLPNVSTNLFPKNLGPYA